jgi:glutathione peroxidase
MTHQKSLCTTRRSAQLSVHVSLLATVLLFTTACTNESSSMTNSVSGPSETEQPNAEQRAASSASTPVDVVIKDIDGRDLDLKTLRGKAVLVVNTASQCGYTPQYAGLEKLHRAYKEKGLVVLAVPSNDFGGQEPGTNEDIKEFTSEKFEVTFSLMDKVHATGDEISPLFQTLTASGPTSTRGPVKWNFTKFLIDPEGKIVERFESKIDPMSTEVTTAVERVLPKT